VDGRKLYGGHIVKASNRDGLKAGFPKFGFMDTSSASEK
jgi:hypothetical protein